MTTSTSLGALTTTLLNANTFHPTLSITLARTTIPSSISHASCSANLLINLPSGVFYDPFTASNPIVGSGSGSRGQVISTSGLELEHAVGWTSRSMQGRTSRQWWERSDDDEEQEGGGVDLQDLLGAALRRKAQEVERREVEGGAVRVSLDSKKVRVKAKGQMRQRQEFKQERSTVVIPVDELLRTDGGLFKVQIPLHVRYHPTIDSDANPSFSTSFAELFHQLIPISPTSSPQHLKLTLTHPTLYISCPSSSSSTRSPTSLLPASHIHLKPLLTNHLSSSDKVVAHTSTSGTLVLQVPTPPAKLLTAVRAVTLITVVAVCAAVLGHLLVNIVPMLDAVEKMG
ncbi:ferredoxin/adrenodoxin reductase [Pseudozyma hubeiensis SY62]|uniref:Ferredoxin/adrenodoxin reductase n=1 Tax=Pseudozyma hubeiensis (strain SY62) TaxID=1305764 RepID=R9P1P4_PSEHS|nr:ferredoxin/adrenodoxin reductase [Pseudozyma hubeiensis SY62]GAC95119.1 ferredoxin/adrenodoxin reductase [Pseudozyma hubeiensis SY62]